MGMVELRWLRVPDSFDQPGFQAPAAHPTDKIVLQYRYVIPRHKGFVMQPGPTHGGAVEDSDRWSEWMTVNEVSDVAEEDAA
jgi:hypothetical protein